MSSFLSDLTTIIVWGCCSAGCVEEGSDVEEARKMWLVSDWDDIKNRFLGRKR